MVAKVRYLLLFICSVFLFQCDFEKEVNIPLPDYSNTPYIECYLEPGKPYRLLVYKSIGYFEELVPVPIRDANITITHRGTTIILPYDTIPRDGDLRFYNYRSKDSLVPLHYDEAFDLAVTINGVTYTSVTTIRTLVAIDSLYNNCNNEKRCQITIRFKDQANTADFYRFLTFSDSLGGDIKQDFLLNDELFDTENAGIGGGYSFNEGQGAVVRLFHLTKEHYDFLTSVKNSQNANGNPFAQPASIKSNIPGLIGIFSGLTYDSKKVEHVEE
ncbi:MAG: DUF4249 domain-containing protein [Cytophagaceae bacterium]|nr:DUF4249 domain-containing protein [Cytophagaceae bacterium]